MSAGRAVFESTPDGIQPDDQIVLSQIANPRANMPVVDKLASHLLNQEICLSPQMKVPQLLLPSQVSEKPHLKFDLLTVRNITMNTLVVAILIVGAMSF